MVKSKRISVYVRSQDDEYARAKAKECGISRSMLISAALGLLRHAEAEHIDVFGSFDMLGAAKLLIGDEHLISVCRENA